MAKMEHYVDIGGGVLVPSVVALNAAGGAIGSGATSTPKNASVSVANTTTALIAAATEVARTALIRNTGDRTVYVAFGEAATTSKFPLGVGETLKSDSLLAINGITASGTGTVFVLAEAR